MLVASVGSGALSASVAAVVAYLVLFVTRTIRSYEMFIKGILVLTGVCVMNFLTRDNLVGETWFAYLD
jgi:hypothetical protein